MASFPPGPGGPGKPGGALGGAIGGMQRRLGMRPKRPGMGGVQPPAPRFNQQLLAQRPWGQAGGNMGQAPAPPPPPLPPMGQAGGNMAAMGQAPPPPMPGVGASPRRPPMGPPQMQDDLSGAFRGFGG